MQTTTTRWQPNIIDQKLIDLALDEDLGAGGEDVTTDRLITGHRNLATARIISKHAGPVILCGLPVVRAVLSSLGVRLGQDVGGVCDIQSGYDDGIILPPGAELAKLTADPRLLLLAERTLLNFLQRLCAIATHTGAFVAKVRHTRAKILDTRKTTPGWRHLEKYAVQCGGGVNHRMGLYDALMIKDTHIDFSGGIEKALARLPAGITQTMPVIVEVRDLDELNIVLDQGLNKTTRVLLDNMSLDMLRECVAACKGRIPTEASGNISLENAAQTAETGVDFLSVGRLTHSAGNVDLSMKSDIQHV